MSISGGVQPYIAWSLFKVGGGGGGGALMNLDPS